MRDDVLPVAARRVITAIGLIAIAAVLVFAAVSFSAEPQASSMTPQGCAAAGGVWEPDVIGHDGHCDR